MYFIAVATLGCGNAQSENRDDSAEVLTSSQREPKEIYRSIAGSWRPKDRSLKAETLLLSKDGSVHEATEAGSRRQLTQVAKIEWASGYPFILTPSVDPYRSEHQAGTVFQIALSTQNKDQIFLIRRLPGNRLGNKYAYERVSD